MEQLRPTDPAAVSSYQLVARLGGGGMGRVFLAQSPGGRNVAIKVIRAELADDDNFRERFRREVAAARRVSGVFTAPVIDADVDASPPWLATAYVPGPSLANAVAANGAFPAESVQILAAGLAEALSAIHRAGVVHRDLSPSNILLAEDGPRVIDFGIARAADDTRLTNTGMLIGKPGFMAPEQALGREAEAATDIFALGAVLFFALSGSGPFGRGNAPQLLYRVVHSRPAFEELPANMRDIVAWCMDAKPENRPTAAQLLDALVPQGEQAASLMAGSWLPQPVARQANLMEAAIDSNEPLTPWPTPPPTGSRVIHKFRRPKFRRRALWIGYDVRDVENFVDRVMAATEAIFTHSGEHRALTVQDIRDVAFRVRFMGYDEWQVDLWLDEVEHILREAETPNPAGSSAYPHGQLI